MDFTKNPDEISVHIESSPFLLLDQQSMEYIQLFISMYLKAEKTSLEKSTMSDFLLRPRCLQCAGWHRRSGWLVGPRQSVR